MKVQNHVRVTELDGREFIRKLFADAWNNPIPAPPPYKSAKQKARERHYKNAPPADAAAAATAQQQQRGISVAEPTRDGAVLTILS